MSDSESERELLAAVRGEVESWAPDRGADWKDLMRRADHAWRRPILLVSTAGAAGLAVLLAAALAVVALTPAVPGLEVVRDHLVSR